MAGKSFFRPRRGKKGTATSLFVGKDVLKEGEMFMEVPDTGVGTGAGKIKLGDGNTNYANLPYFIDFSKYATKEELNNVGGSLDLSAYAKKTELDSYVKKTDAAGYALKSELSDYAKKSEISETYLSKADASSNYAAKSDIANLPTSTDLDSYVKKTEFSTQKLKSTIDWMNIGNVKTDGTSSVGDIIGALTLLTASMQSYEFHNGYTTMGLLSHFFNLDPSDDNTFFGPTGINSSKVDAKEISTSTFTPVSSTTSGNYLMRYVFNQGDIVYIKADGIKPTKTNGDIGGTINYLPIWTLTGGGSDDLPIFDYCFGPNTYEGYVAVPKDNTILYVQGNAGVTPYVRVRSKNYNGAWRFLRQDYEDLVKKSITTDDLFVYTLSGTEEINGATDTTYLVTLEPDSEMWLFGTDSIDLKRFDIAAVLGMDSNAPRGQLYHVNLVRDSQKNISKVELWFANLGDADKPIGSINYTVQFLVMRKEKLALTSSNRYEKYR